MITKEIAVTLTYGKTLYHRTLRSRDGSAVCCRINGQCKVWVRQPKAFRLPVKHGLRDCFYIEEGNAADWLLEDPTAQARYEEQKAKSKKKLCKQFKLSEDTPDYVIRDRMLDEGISEAQWPQWVLAVK